MKSKRIPYLTSIVIHLLLFLILWLVKINLEPVEDEYVTIGFGAIGKLSSSGVLAKNIVEDQTRKEVVPEKKVEKKTVKKVKLPEVKNASKSNNVVTASKKESEKEESTPDRVEPLVKEKKESGKGKEETGEGEGNFGFDIDFGGKGKRKIYSYSLPEYPAGVSKEIDVKLKFTILADGTVGRILPLIKADTKLEQAAITSLRKWRFEPLPEKYKNKTQTAVIIFPFRLN